MPPPFFIVGPTAVGKTGIAVEVAARCGAEIVNADAFQLYEGLRLLTAKPTSEQLRRVPHHLVGAIPLTESFSVAQYMQRARSCLDGLARQQRPAIVVGGSGMYVKALTHGLAPLPPAQPALRAELEAMDTDGLLRSLRTLDPVTAARIDARNKRRLIRALEVCLTTGKTVLELPRPVELACSAVQGCGGLSGPGEDRIKSQNKTPGVGNVCQRGDRRSSSHPFTVHFGHRLPDDRMARNPGAPRRSTRPGQLHGANRNGYPPLRQASDDMVSR